MGDKGAGRHMWCRVKVYREMCTRVTEKEKACDSINLFNVFHCVAMFLSQTPST
jgi:hypothetical protein